VGERERVGAGASSAFEPPEVGGGSLIHSLAEGAVFPPVALGLGPGMERRSLLRGGASGIPKGGVARFLVETSYEIGWPSYFNVVRRKKTVGVRRV
jgi:hypothetical protein